MKVSQTLHRFAHSVWRKKGVLSTLLLPLSWIASALVARKREQYAHQPLRAHARVPVVVVGNIYVGGTGKTPVVLALVQALQRHGWKPGVVSRGYGVKIGDRARTGMGDLAANEFGDEPALIARSSGAPISVHPDRVEAVKRLQRDFPEVDVIVSDDGLQHLAMGRDLEILVQDTRGVGNGRMLPAGPLREPAERLRYVDVIVTNVGPVDPDPARVDSMATQVTMRLAPARAEQLTSGQTYDWDEWMRLHASGPVSAVAAIGQPARFFDMLRHHGVTLSQTVSLQDHDDFKTSPFPALSTSIILITSKDAVKCRHLDDARIWVVHAEPRFSDPWWLNHVHGLLKAIARHKLAMAPGRQGD